MAVNIGDILFAVFNKKNTKQSGLVKGDVIFDGVSIDSNLHDGTGNPITSTTVGSDQALDVNVIQSSPSTGSQEVKFSKSPNIDAFGRLRVSQVTTQFDAKQLHDALPLFIDEETIGTGASAHSTTLAESQLTTAAASDAVILQTKQRFNYQSGKSQLLFWTFNNMDNETNVTKRVGYFSSNTTTPFDSTKDGFWLQSDGTNMSIQISRSGTSTASVNRSSWDDPLDGTGPSGVTHDFDNNTILVCSYEWLGVGEVQFGIVKDGVIVPFHYEDFTDTTSVYMSSPNQPMRWEMRQNGAGSGSLNVICSSVNSEGAINRIGKILSDNLGTAHVNANSTASKYALLGIRLQIAKIDTLVDLINFSILAITNDNQLVEVWLNPTVTGTFTYNSVTNSSVQIAKGAGATVSGGTLLYSKYVSAQDATPIELENALRLGMSIAGVQDEIVITTNPLTSNSDVLASMDWRESA